MSASPPLGRCMIINAYSHRNVGDAAIVLATDKLLNALGATEVVNATRYHDEDRAFYERHGIRITPSPISFPVRTSHGEVFRAARFALSAISVLLRIAASRAHPSGAAGRALPAGFARADVVVLCGGGYLYSARRRLNLTMLHAVAQSLAAAFSGKRVIMMPQSIGPLRRGWERWLISMLLNRVETVVCRERLSAEYVGSLCPDLNVEVVPDVAFYAFTLQGTHEVVANPLVTLIPMDWTWAREVERVALDQYVSKLAQLGQELVRRGFRVQVTGSSSVTAHDQDDWQVAARLVEAVGRGAELVGPPDSPTAQVMAFRNSDLVITTRMHSAILALCAGTPAIALAYQQKTSGTFELLGLSDWAEDVEDFEARRMTGHALAVAGDETSKSRAASAAAQAAEAILCSYRAQCQGLSS